MAWTDICKTEACNQINVLKTEYGGIKPAIRHLSVESGIPIRTIQSWYWPSKNSGAETCADADNCEPVQQDTKELETLAIPELQWLIDNNRKFNTIYADPPWPYDNQATRSATCNIYKKGEFKMSMDDLKAMPINSLSNDNCHLHLWTTNGFLHEAMHLIESWGFTYKSCFVWVKPRMGIGNYWRVSHEFLLFALKGKQPFMAHDEMSWMEMRTGKHSSKPEAIRKKIEKVSPGPYLELFARKVAPGWVSWGNEIERTLFNGQFFVESQ